MSLFENDHMVEVRTEVTGISHRHLPSTTTWMSHELRRWHAATPSVDLIILHPLDAVQIQSLLCKGGKRQTSCQEALCRSGRGGGNSICLLFRVSLVPDVTETIRDSRKLGDGA